MKYIFDFDDVLFDTRRFKERVFTCLKKVGISRAATEEHYRVVRGTEEPFSLKKFLADLLPENVRVENVYEDIMRVCQSFVNQELVGIIRELGQDDCFIVTHGDEEFQQNKIERSAISMLFGERHIVTGSKKELVQEICARYKNETVVFLDDKASFFNDIDHEKCPNLKTILYDEKGLKSLMAIIRTDSASELKRRK